MKTAAVAARPKRAEHAVVPGAIAGRLHKLLLLALHLHLRLLRWRLRGLLLLSTLGLVHLRVKVLLLLLLLHSLHILHLLLLLLHRQGHRHT